MAGGAISRIDAQPPRDPVLAWAREQTAREAWEARAKEAEEAAVSFQSRAVAAEAKLELVLADVERDGKRQHRLGYLEARWRYALLGLGGGILLTLAVGELNSRFEVARQERAVEVGNDAFTRGIAVGSVQRETSETADDAGHSRGREPASAPK